MVTFLKSLIHAELGTLPDDGDIGLVHDFLGGGLDAHVPDGRGGRPHEDDAGLLAEVRELDVLGEEAVARVDGLRAGPLGDLDDLLLLQVALNRRGEHQSDMTPSLSMSIAPARDTTEHRTMAVHFSNALTCFVFISHCKFMISKSKRKRSCHL